MASLYKNNGIWYITVSHNGTGKYRSLKTKCIQVTKSIKFYSENTTEQMVGRIIKSNAKLLFSELIDHFIKAPRIWSTTTYDLNKYILTYHLEGKYFPINPRSRAIHIRHINQCWNLGIKNILVEKAQLIPRDTKGESRLRT